MKKRKLSLLFTLLILCGSLMPVFAGDGSWNEAIYRVNDFAEVFAEEEREALEDRAYTAVERCRCDFPIVFDYLDEDRILEEYAAGYYDYNGYGYGPDKDGILFAADMTLAEYAVLPFGKFEALLNDDVLSELCETLNGWFNEKSLDEAMGSYIDLVSYMAEYYRDNGELPQDFLRLNNTLPDWYPEDAASFEDFHDAEAPRLVDDADMFTDEEEAALLSRINALIDKHGVDFVLFTDMSTYGFSPDVYSADFHHFNGYGFGDDYTGSVLFICMDPLDRLWWTSATGAVESYYNMENINRIDDAIEPQMIDGDYFGAMCTYIDMIDTLYTGGGTLPRDPSEYVPPAVIAAIIALIIMCIVRNSLLKGMKKVVQAADADRYLVKDSFNLRSKKDTFLYSNVVKVRRESSGTRSGGSHSSGGSYHSSGGRSYSGGGRHF